VKTLQFEEWKDEFSIKCEAVIKAHKSIHDHLKEIDEDVDEDEFLLFVAIKSKRIEKALDEL